MAHKKEVVENHRDIVKKLEDSVMELNKEFKVPVTPKLHIIFEHLPEYFELTGKTLRKKTDQTVESTHAKLDKFIRSHNYQLEKSIQKRLKNISSEQLNTSTVIIWVKQINLETTSV